MLLSQTAHYALRAVYYLLTANSDDWHLTKDIAVRTKIPAPYLARILSTLAKRGILQSRTGMGGGFRVGEDRLQTTLYDVVFQFDNLDNIQDCIFGFIECCENDQCLLHKPWLHLKDQLIVLLKSTTLKNLKEHHKFFDWSEAKI
jgi:Rrf2 family protein